MSLEHNMTCTYTAKNVLWQPADAPGMMVMRCVAATFVCLLSSSRLEFCHLPKVKERYACLLSYEPHSF